MILLKETKDATMYLTLIFARNPSAPSTGAQLGTCLICAFLHWVSLCGMLQAQMVHPYRTPQAIGLTSQLLAPSPFSNTKLKMPLSDWVQTMMVRDQIPVWLDRRVPSDVELGVDIPKEQSNLDVLNLVASQLDAEIACVDRYVVLAPKQAASAIEWSYWTLCSGASNPSLRANRKDTFEWTDGSDTREIWSSFIQQYRLTALADSGGLVKDFDRWRAGRLESTNLAAIATLLLCGFDQRLAWPADGSPRIEPLSGDYQKLSTDQEGDFVRFRYAAEIPKIGKSHWQAWRGRWPEARVERIPEGGPGKSEAWDISAPVAAHRQLIQPLAPPPKPKTTSSASPKKYTGRYRGEIGKILDNLSQQLSLTLAAQDLSVNLARQEVDVSFNDASLDELLAQLGEASRLKITLQGKSLVVEPLEP
jgi:hypothetical protein